MEKRKKFHTLRRKIEFSPKMLKVTNKSLVLIDLIILVLTKMEVKISMGNDYFFHVDILND